MSGREIALVGVGGAIGTLMRYGAIRAFPIEPGSFPTTILVVNLIASIALGYLLAVLSHRPDLRTLLVPGVVGGFGRGNIARLTRFATALSRDRGNGLRL
jgi:CrcB protein